MTPDELQQFELALAQPCMAITARGLRIDEERRRSMIAVLEEEIAPLREELQEIVVPLLGENEAKLKKLKKWHLFEERWCCSCCRGGKKKSQECWSCAGFEKSPTKKMLLEFAEKQDDWVSDLGPPEMCLFPCKVCNGIGKGSKLLYNPAGVEQTKIVLYDLCKLPKRMLKKKLTIEEDKLKTLVVHDKRGIVVRLLTITKHSTIISILERMKPGEDGRLRTFLNPAGTETGRFSSSGGFLEPFSTNLQNLPKREAAKDPKYDVRRCVIPDEGCVLLEADLCVAGNTRVLKADLTWARAKDLRIDDELVSFDEDLSLGHRHRFWRSKVTNNEPLVRRCVRVVTDRESVICSEEHKWITRKGGQGRRWTEAKNLQHGDRIPWIGYPWSTEYSYDAGWLAGLFDGEGHLCDSVVGFTQKEGKGVWERAIPLLENRGFRLSKDRNSGGIPRANFKTIYDNLRFLGQIRPCRLLQRSLSVWEGRRTWGNQSESAVVLGIHRLEEQTVYPVSTTTHTFVAEGMLCHNSQAEARVTAYLADDAPLIRRWEHASFDVHRWMASVAFGKEMSEVTRGEREYVGKTIGHAANYGTGAKTYMNSVNAESDLTGFTITLDFAERGLANVHRVRPALKRWWRGADRKLRTEGSLTTVWGRKRTFFGRRQGNGWLDHTHKEAIAFEPQSTVADVLNKGLLAWWERFDGRLGLTLLQIHDAVLIQTEKPKRAMAARALRECLTIPMQFGERELTIPVDVSWSARSWGKMEEL